MLSENNFVIWNRAIKMALCAKQKLDGNSALMGNFAGGETKNFLENRRVFKKPWDDKKLFLKCDYCGVKGHSKDTCFKLNGYPKKGGNNRNQFQKGKFPNQG
ncbi:hypothetical protein LIER_35116 [Lithospermum erythrorhizon]|uniref:Retrotransposon Copia-like N-terminal domain-containing protein n=1 Tax=Lithospermum erythrorhizon TaxID=34254 RepID=A0AAV3NJZ3_LITER